MSASVLDTVGRRTWIQLPNSLQSPLGIVGAVIVSVWVLVAVFAPFLTPSDPLALSDARLQPPSSQNLLGTDAIGRDVFSRLLFGTRTAMLLSLLIVLCSMAIGSALGAIAGYFGRWVDEIIMRLTDLVFAFPTIILAMVIAAALGPSLTNAALALLIVSWTPYARVTRSLVITVRQSEYVVAGRLLGAGSFTSLRRDVVPNVSSTIVILGMLNVGTMILDMSALSFLGLGVIPPAADWGSMVSEGTKHFTSWWIALFPGLAILTTVVGFNLLGDSMRDALDPQTSKLVKEGAR